jgi:hypothetical protein
MSHVKQREICLSTYIPKYFSQMKEVRTVRNIKVSLRIR